MPKNPTNQDNQTIDMTSPDKDAKKKLAANPFGSVNQMEMRSNEIEEGLSEIYQDEDGQIVNMKNAEIIHGRTWLYRLFIWLFNILLIGGLVWAGFYYFNQYKSANDTGAIEFTLDGPKTVIAGQEVTYTVSYKNFDRISLKNSSVRLTYPEGFIFASAEPAPTQGTDFWTIGDVDKLRSGEIKIKGYLVNEIGKNEIALASFAYTPANFSSEFKKDASSNAVIESTNLDFSFDFPQSVMVGDQNDLYITYRKQEGAIISNFRLTVAKLDNLSFGTTSNPVETGVYHISMSDIIIATSTAKNPTASTSTSTPLAMGSQGEIRIPLIFKERLNNIENLKLNFEYSPDGQNYYSFLKKEIPVDVLTKSVNLDLLINGSKDDQGVDFGQTLNYSIAYANKGEQPIKNLVIVAVIDSEFLDWSSLADKNKGKLSGNKILWSKDEIADLANLPAGQEGTIDFSINIASSTKINPVKNYQIKSYARYSIGYDASSTTPAADSEANRSNAITNKINSNLDLSEQIRYFDDDNIAVGSGPQPMKVGQATGYRVYWELTNSLNELNNLKIETTLPEYVSFDAKNVSDLGSVSFDQASRKVTWDIGKLKIATTKASAQFNISVTPTSTDANKIIVLLNEATVTATDSSTNNEIKKSLKAKNSKLVDDPAVIDDGRVVQ
jgi:uncharacterized repeat protein (TIGR01451 family)